MGAGVAAGQVRVWVGAPVPVQVPSVPAPVSPPCPPGIPGSAADPMELDAPALLLHRDAPEGEHQLLPGTGGEVPGRGWEWERRV